MAHDDLSRTDRRTFLQAGAVLAASAAALPTGSPAVAQDAPAAPVILPKRPLGKTGVEVTLLDIGTGRGRGVGRRCR